MASSSAVVPLGTSLYGKSSETGTASAKQFVLVIELRQGDETRPLFCCLLGQEGGDATFHVLSDRLHGARAVHHENQQRRIEPLPLLFPSLGSSFLLSLSAP